MTFFSSRNTRSQLFLVPLFALASVVLAGCPDNHIGRPCDPQVPGAGSDPNNVVVNSQALECPSRVCVLPAQEKSTDTGPFCTAECSSDDDCQTDERRGSDSTDKRCRSSFVCRTIIPKIEGNPLSCKPICVCKDFLNLNEAASKPPSCN